MAASNKTKLSNLSYLTENGGTKLFRKLFLNKVRELMPHHENPESWTTDAFLRINKETIESLKLNIKSHQILFPVEGKHTKLELWDLTLLINMLTSTCQLNGNLKTRLMQLKKIRNKLAHFGDSVFTDAQYTYNFEKVKVIFETFLKELNDGEMENTIRVMFETFEKGEISEEELTSALQKLFLSCEEIKESEERTRKHVTEENQETREMIQKGQSELLCEMINLRKAFATIGGVSNGMTVPVKIKPKNCDTETEETISQELVELFTEAIKNNVDHSKFPEDDKGKRAIIFKVYRNLKENGYLIVNAERGCMLLQFKFPSVSAMLSFYIDYIQGNLETNLNELKMAAQADGSFQDSFFEMYLYEDDLRQILRNIKKTMEENEIISRFATDSINDDDENKQRDLSGTDDSCRRDTGFPSVLLKLKASKDFEQHDFEQNLQWASEQLTKLYNSPIQASIVKNKKSVMMTQKEREEMELTEIDILMGDEDECFREFEMETLSDEDRRKQRNDAQTKFYRGETVTWWNFYYKNHVCKRSLFERHMKEIEKKLSNSGALIEVHELEHHPGAGGTTLGRHLIWHFSQSNGRHGKSHRCCVVQNMNVTDETIKQIVRFRSFKEDENPRPFIVLADNINEENIMLLKAQLKETAYKIGNPGYLFCLVLIVNRRQIVHNKSGGIPVLTHQLNKTEKIWFEEKYMEMENSSYINVNTLVAFNLMRTSFDKKYLHTTIANIMQSISKKEMGVLKCLALINSYDINVFVPEYVFDIKMNEQVDYETSKRLPWEISKARNERWNIHTSDAMDLLITKKEDKNFCNSELRLISQIVAEEVTDYIQRTDGLSIEQLVDCLLDLVEKQMKDTNHWSKKFVNIVCSLFKTRPFSESESVDKKLKFSCLVLELESTLKGETMEKAQQRVLKVMKRCFEITKDAMVGQQLARYNIHIKSFDAAEEAIKMSLEKRQNSSNLLYTYGQILKSKMEYLLATSIRNHNKVDDDSAAHIIELAIKAIEKFKDGHDISIREEENTNLVCLTMEVKTGLAILEQFENFTCYKSRDSFVIFLNDETCELSSFPYHILMEKCPLLEQLRVGSAAQRHLETSLRSLEELRHQLKRKLSILHSEGETLLLTLRERFDRFYGSQRSTSKYQFAYGIGLQSLMTAKENKNNILKERVQEAKNNLLVRSLQNADERDLLVYIGHKIISLSTQISTGENEQCSQEEYRRLLSYCNTLVAFQTSESAQYRRLFLETYLYFGMLHWPLKSRTQQDFEPLAKPKEYEQLIAQWKNAYNSFYTCIKYNEHTRKYKPNNLFALGKGSPGNDIVDLKSISKELINRKKSTGRGVHMPVISENYWTECIVVERLERLEGTVAGSGHVVIHQAEYKHGTHLFRINTSCPCPDLSNKKVTFVLVFKWEGPVAVDIIETGQSHLDEHSLSYQHDGSNDCDRRNAREKGGQHDVKSDKDCSHGHVETKTMIRQTILDKLL